MTSQQQLDAHFEICFGLFSISFLHTSSYTSLVLSRIFFSTMGIENGGYESVEEIQATHSTLVRTFQTGKTKDIAWRKWQLKQLWWLVEENEQAIVDAIKSDLNRPGFETYLTDLAGIRKDILYHLENIDAWAANSKRASWRGSHHWCMELSSSTCTPASHRGYHSRLLRYNQAIRTNNSVSNSSSRSDHTISRFVCNQGGLRWRRRDDEAT
jgi:hypothetical protein